METKFNFKSQICTDKNQSERLLALGLKKETADMFYSTILENDDIARVCYEGFWNSNKAIDSYIRRWSIPAWSLGRLLKLIKHSDICNCNDFGCIMLYIDLDDFETCITMISYMVKEGYFNKEYLV